MNAAGERGTVSVFCTVAVKVIDVFYCPGWGGDLCAAYIRTCGADGVTALFCTHSQKCHTSQSLEYKTNTQITLMSSAEEQNMEPFAFSQLAIFCKRNAIMKTTIHLVQKVKITYTHS